MYTSKVCPYHHNYHRLYIFINNNGHYALCVFMSLLVYNTICRKGEYTPCVQVRCAPIACFVRHTHNYCTTDTCNKVCRLITPIQPGFSGKVWMPYTVLLLTYQGMAEVLVMLYLLTWDITSRVCKI